MASIGFRWLDILEKEFDKAFVDLDLAIGMFLCLSVGFPPSVAMYSSETVVNNVPLKHDKKSFVNVLPDIINFGVYVSVQFLFSCSFNRTKLFLLNKC